jgi:hypothetical protein
MLLLVTAGFLVGPPSVYAVQNIVVNDMDFGVVGESEFMDGYALLLSQPISWESDVGWRITVYSLDPDLGLSNDGLYTKLLSDLQWKLSSGSLWVPMTQDATEVDWSSDTGTGVVYIDAKVLLDWVNDVPGNYQADLVFTIEPL